MKIDFNSMDENIRELYEYMWNDNYNNIPGGANNLCQTYDKRYSKNSKNSYSFEILNDVGKILKNKEIVTKERKQNEKNKKVVCNYLASIFNLKNKEKFEEKFLEVCSGSGAEAAKITTLHSSSLCALLFFYNTEETKISISLNGKVVEFDEVHFEYKNTVTKKGGPSNMDVVLVSNTQHIILFLESKFSEYLKPESVEVRYEYINEFEKAFYNENFLNSINMQILKDKNTGSIKRTRITKKGKKEEYFVLAAADKRPACYAEGIKQMISHYIGVTNFKDGHFCSREKKRLNQNYSVYLGEIVFDFNYEKAKKQLENYESHYKVLVDALQLKKPNFEMLKLPLKYSELKDKCEVQVRKFYYGQ